MPTRKKWAYNPHKFRRKPSKKAHRQVYWFIVEGDGAFPFEMLAYDCSRAITDIGKPEDHHLGRRCVVIETLGNEAPTYDRWSEHGWKVKRVLKEKPTELLGENNGN
jgi:hypothetical protein